MSTPHPIDRAEVIALRQPCENLLRSTLTFMRGLRDEGVVLPLHLRAQRHLVVIDGGTLDLALDAAFPDVADPGALAAHNVLRAELVEAALRDPAGPEGEALRAARFADPLIDDEPYDPRSAADRGGRVLEALRDDEKSSGELADALDRRTGTDSRHGDEIGEAA